jgi:hypothetical protein
MVYNQGMTAVVFSLNAGGGFYSMVFYLCKAHLTARARRVPLYIEDSKWPYGTWREYFRTLDYEVSTRNPYRVAHNAQYSDPDFLLKDYVESLREIYRPHFRLMDRAKQLISRLGPSFVAVFVRRGCKLVEEAPFIPASEIYQQMGISQDTMLFIQTDDYTVVEEFRELHPADRTISTVPITKRGQYHIRRLLDADTRNPHASTIIPLLEQPKEQILEETEEMIVGLEVCRLAPVCWTDVTSNVGRFLKLIGKNAHVYPTDGNFDPEHRGCPAHEIPFISDSPFQSNGH